MNRVLCPVDLSEASARAFHDAVDVARSYEARLTALRIVPRPSLHVLEAFTPSVPPLPLAGPAVAGYLRDLRKHAVDRLRRVILQDASEWCEPAVRVILGEPWREIGREADEHDAAAEPPAR